MIKKIFLFFISLFFFQFLTFAQVENSTSDVMRSYGKIYVVMAVCLTILVGLIGYVIATDRKISKLEKEMK
jgi:hypothetical protein